MKNEQKNTNIEFTKELYMSMSSDITGQIAQTKQDKEDLISKIEGRKEYLRELRADIIKRNEELKQIRLQRKNLKKQIKAEKRLIQRDTREKFALTRQLISKKNDSKKLNTLYVNGETTIDIARFYPTKRQKIR